MNISLRGLGKRFNRTWILQDLDGDFNAPDLIGIAGQNGSGKSTLLRIIGGQLTPSRGEVRREYRGQEIKVEDCYRYLSWTGPYLELVEELTVQELLHFHFALKPALPGLDPAKMLERLELGFAKNRKLSDCSSGMRQRVLLATALYASTPLVLLDEPTVTLDEKAKAWFYAELDACRAGRLVLLASNDPEDLRHCGRIVALNSTN
ncbi:ATP-binding cassette domain-containing protein [Neolewinella lacunae]|uniref:ATP-binding cassette domain-containing protein n=1 Tax=Neolewinella lacunae TaxID=1517758 RepID=A0A923PLR8_9BACT|nr:ATP-binding cassette domain-containing protein [Neolewinella lacunae]MBC6996503.1 ATP-binding cassette domain-containing protein [Neolewinella lacunae]MDN3636656.1 ATP-binding cassette domain-containing protein [Neolewinella lacunae]